MSDAYDDLKIQTGDSLSVNDWDNLVDRVSNVDGYTHRINLAEDGKLGVGKIHEMPKGPLHIMDIPGHEEPHGGLNDEDNGLMLGSAGRSSYKWIQSYGGSLVINPKGNSVGIGTASPKEAFQIGDRWTFHSGGSHVISYNAYWNPDEGKIRRLVRGFASEIRFEADGDLVISTGAGKEDANEVVTFSDTKRVFFKNNGNVGIGTNTPGAKVDVVGKMRISNQGDGKVLLDLGTDRNWEFRQLGSGATTALELRSAGGGGNKNFMISTDGNVGIGKFTKAPSAKLHVVGRIISQDIATNTKMIEFHKITSFTYSSGKFYSNTNKKVDAWEAGIVGFDTGKADILEHDTRNFMRMYMDKHNGKWRVVASLVTESHDDGGNENWTVYVMFVRNGIGSRHGYDF